MNILKITTKIRSLFPINPSEVKIAYQVLSGWRQPGVMIDIGAHHGESIAMFAESGWEIHAFEPDPENRKELEMRLGDHRKVVINANAVSDKNQELLFQHIILDSKLACFQGVAECFE